MIKLSKYSDSQINEQKSRIFIQTIAIDNGWKYRTNELDNDIDGELEIFNKTQKDEFQTTTKIIKIQLKSIENLSIRENEIIYKCPIKLLHYSDIADIPIVLLVYHVEKNYGYALFLQEYIYLKLDVENPNWRNNNENVSIKIPTNNSITTEKINFDFKAIAFNGINQIAQLRKVNTINNYFEILKRDDNSHGTARRAAVRILVENSFSTSKDAMKILIPKINEIIKNDKYFRNDILKQKFCNTPCDVVWLHFYNSLKQDKNGLPFCQTTWIRADLKDKPMPTKFSEKVEEIGIVWNDTSFLDNLVMENRMDKGDFFVFADNIFAFASKLFIPISLIHKRLIEKLIDLHNYKQELSIFSEKLDELYSKSEKNKFAPIECYDLDLKLKCLVTDLHNIKIVVNDNSRTNENIFACVKMYLESAEKNIEHFKYERDKVK